MNKKIVIILSFFILLTGIIYAQIPLSIEITNVQKQGGKIYCGIYSNEESYKKKQMFQSFVVDAIDTVITIETTVPTGDYVVSIFQDSNNNEKLDTKAFGIPKEPVGISNYDGKGIPGNFNKLKQKIEKGIAKINIVLYTL